MKSNTKSTFERNPLAASISLESLALSGVLVSQLFMAPLVTAAPSGGVIVGGEGSISKGLTTTRIHQTSNALAINWNSFNVGRHQQVVFEQPSTSALVLNRILDQNPSTIRGSIVANGNVLLVNPRGIMFTESATVNVGGLVASGLDVSVDDFMNGELLFKGVEGESGAVINKGTINASSAALIGKAVHNAPGALVSADLVSLAVGEEALLTFDADGLMGVKVTKEVLENDLRLDSALLNEGRIEGGKVLLEASVTRDLFSNAVNNEGVVRAEGIDVSGGSIRLLGRGSRVVNSGEISVSGSSGGSLSVEADQLVNQGQMKAQGAPGSLNAIRIDAGELHNAGVIDGDQGGMSIELGREAADSEHILGDLRAEGDITVNARGGESGTDSFSFTAGGHYALGKDGKITTEGITISGADLIDAGGEGVLQGHEDVAETFTITGNKTLQVSNTTFTHISMVDGGAGPATDSVTGASDWALNGANSITAQGISFTDVEHVVSVEGGRLTGRDDVAESFAITGSQSLQVEGITFDKIAVVNAGAGSVPDGVTGADHWALNGSKSVKAEGITFTDVEKAGSETLESRITGREEVAESFAITGNKAILAEGIEFTNISAVDGGSGLAPDSVTGAARWELNGSKSVKAEGITFTDVEKAGSGAVESHITGRDNEAETFNITGSKALTAEGIDFTNVTTVDAGSGTVTDRVSGATKWQLNGNHSLVAEHITFTGIEAAGTAEASGTIHASDSVADTFVITGNRALTVDGIAFSHIAAVEAGSGAEDRVTGASDWALQGNQSVRAAEIVFSGVEHAGSADQASRIAGENYVAESFAITGNNNLSVQGIAFENVTRVDAGEGAQADSVQGASEWLLSGQQSVTAAGIVFTGIEKAGSSDMSATVTGRNNVAESFVLNGSNALTVDDIAFTHITTVNAGSGAAADRVSGAASWTLNGNKSVDAHNITFTDVELLEGMISGSSITARADVAESFVITGNQELRVDDMTFSNVATVAAGDGEVIDSVTGAANWELQGARRVRARGIEFAGIEQVNGGGTEISISGRDHVAESFVVTDSKKLTVDEMVFSNVIGVNAGSGSVADLVSGAMHWALNGDNSVIAGGMTFRDVEKVSGSGTGSTLTGQNDIGESFAITGSKALTANNMIFDNISVVKAGGGAAPDRVAGSTRWLLNGIQSVNAEEMTFYGVEEVGAVTDHSQLTGSVNTTETFILTGNNRLTTSGINFVGVDSVIGQSTDRVQDGGDLHYELHSQTEARVANLHLQGLALANIQWDAGDSITVADDHTLSGKTIDSKGAQVTGSTDADTFTVASSNTVDYREVKFTNVTRVNALDGQDSVVGATDWALQGNNSVHGHGITFNNVEQVGSEAAESQVTGRADVAEAFAIAGSNALHVDGMTFANVTAVDGGGGTAVDRVTGADKWQLNGSRSVVAGGMTFTDIEQAGTAGRAGVLVGRNDVAESFVITGDQALTVDDIAFTHISTVEAGHGAVADQVAGATDWGLQGHQRVSARGMTFSGVEQAGSAGMANRISGQNGVGEAYVITGKQALTVAGISFNGVDSVVAGSGAAADRVTGADEWQLNGHQSVKAAGITFAGVEQAGSNAMDSRIAGRDQVAESFTITDEKTLTAEGIAFTNVTAVDAGSGAVADRVSGAQHWQLQGNQSVTANGIIFSGIEQATGVESGSRISGRDHVVESFAITGNQALAVDGIAFKNVAEVNAGSGVAADRVSGAAEWQLNGKQSVKGQGITFNGIELAGSSGLSSRITGQDGVSESFVITGRNAVAVDDVQFDNITEVRAGTGGNDLVESAAATEWQLTGAQQELMAQEITFKGIETAQHADSLTGYSRVRGSEQADSFNVAGAREIIANGVRIKGIDNVDGRGNAGGGDVLVSNQVEVWQLSSDAQIQVEHSGIRFTGLEEVQGAMGSSLKGTSGNDDFVVGAQANRVSRDNLTYSNITHIDGGAGEDTLNADRGYIWQLTDTAKELVANGITYSNIDRATSADAIVKGRDGVADIFDIDANLQQLKTRGMTFNQVARVEGGTGAGDTVIAHAALEWQLTPEHNSLQAAGMTFTDIETASLGAKVTAPVVLRGSVADETFDITGSQRNAVSVNGIAFTGVGTVHAGAGENRVVSADAERWSLTGANGQVNAEDIQFSGVSSAGAGAGTMPSSILRGSGDDETYVIDAQQQIVEVAGIRFDHLGAVDAGGGQDTVLNTREAHWRAAERGGSWSERDAETRINSIWVVFANIEQVMNTGKFSGPLVGVDYTLTDAHAVRVGGINFGGVSAIHAGSGIDTLHGLDLDTDWTLNGTSGSSQFLSFSGIDTIRAGSARDVFTFNSGVSGNVFTGDGDDTVYLNGGSVAGLYLQGGADRVFINNAASLATLLDGGAGTDLLTSGLTDLTWQITGDVNQVNYLGAADTGNYAFTGFENLRNNADDLRVNSTLGASFDVDHVVFRGAGIHLDYRPAGDIQLTSHYRGADAINGNISAGSLDIRAAGDVDLTTRVDRLSVLNQDNRSIKVNVREADGLVIGQIHAGVGGTISLSSMGLGALTAEARGVTHLKADTVNLGSEWQRWSAIGEQLIPLRMEVGRAVNIVALSYVEPEFVQGIPALTASGNRLQSVTGAVAAQGMKSAVQVNVEEFTQVDPAIFTAISPYSVTADALNAPEYALLAGEMVPAGGNVQASGEVDGELTTLKEEDE